MKGRGGQIDPLTPPPRKTTLKKPSLIRFKGARQSYTTYLDDANTKKIQTKDNEKAKHINLDIENLKQKLKTNQKAVSVVGNEYTQCLELAEKKLDLTCVVKGNGLKDKCDQFKEEMKTIEQDILALEVKKKKLLEKRY